VSTNSIVINIVTIIFGGQTSTKPRAYLIENVRGCNDVLFSDDNMMVWDLIRPLESHGKTLKEKHVSLMSLQWQCWVISWVNFIARLWQVPELVSTADV